MGIDDERQSKTLKVIIRVTHNIVIPNKAELLGSLPDFPGTLSPRQVLSLRPGTGYDAASLSTNKARVGQLHRPRPRRDSTTGERGARMPTG